MIGVDWGTSSLRAVLLRNGRVVARHASADGILRVAEGDFAGTLQRAVAPWLAAGETRILMAGMIGSRQGWREAPYVGCPAGPAELAAHLVSVPLGLGEAWIVPGVRTFDAAGVPEVMRGEETQIAGVVRGDATACLPGSHSKWADIRGGRLTGFTTHMTGEAFAALREHTILGRMMQDAPVDQAAFRQGLERAGQAGGLLHHLFGVRTLRLFAQLPETAASHYLSGLLIGHEVAAAAPRGPVHLIGAPELCGLYAEAVRRLGGEPILAGPDAAAHGLALIAETAGWT
ncbi:MAG: 2-dehydro-3-deoxygalactonokinase [Acetobacteraceae bacterium]